MTDRYARSTDGNDADDGSTWALAKATLTGLAAIDTAGDRLFVSDAHAESTAGAVTLAFAGTLASPTLVICGDDAAEPPTAVTATGSVTTTGSVGNITLQGAAVYMRGLIFNVGTGTGSSSFIFSSAGKLQLDTCVINFPNTETSSTRLHIGNNSAVRSHAHFQNVSVTFGATAQGVLVSGGSLVWEGGGVTSGSAVTALFKAAAGNSRGSSVLLSGLDLSGCATAVVLFAAGGTSPYDAVIRDCKLPASWSGTLANGTFAPGQRFEMYNCDSGDTNYRLWVEDEAGSTKHETTIVRTGGASDGTTGLAWKMVTSANAEFPMIRHESPEMVIWSDTTGAKTVTVEVVHDSQGAGSGSKFQDDEIWLEVMYLGTSGFPLGTWITDCKADVLATAANQADSTETWTTTGMTTPVKQKLSVSITTAEKGFIHARVVMANASKTAYVCPKVAVA